MHIIEQMFKCISKSHNHHSCCWKSPLEQQMCINLQMWIVLNKCSIYTSSGKFLNIREPICCWINELSHIVKATHLWVAFKGWQLQMKTLCSRLSDTDSLDEDWYTGWVFYELIVKLLIPELLVYLQWLTNVLIHKVKHNCEMKWKWYIAFCY